MPVFRSKCKIPISSWPVRISILTTCAMWSCIVNFLIRARDCDVWIHYFCQSWFEILLDLSYFYLKLLFLNIIFLPICQMCNCIKYFMKSFLITKGLNNWTKVTIFKTRAEHVLRSVDCFGWMHQTLENRLLKIRSCSYFFCQLYNGCSKKCKRKAVLTL